MNLLTEQIDTKNKIKAVAQAMGVNPAWAASIAMVESSLGISQRSPTKCKGVFQMSSIAMKDLLQEMEKNDDDLIDIACGIAFLHLLLKRHGSIRVATSRFCDPADRDFYVPKVFAYMDVFKDG